ncbi:extracellular substrate-binding protein [Bordetella pertussis]|nr:extracellular substrate-binding protein [Bordetella pertussis]
MQLVEPTEADVREVKQLLKTSIVPMWIEDCSKFSKTCGDDWFRTIGAAAGIAR